MMTDAAARPPRRRITLAVLAAATVGLGLLSRSLTHGTFGDIAGDALYAVLIYLLVVFVRPRARLWQSAIAAFVICGGIELFQLTGLPRAWAAEFAPVALVLGTGFDARDILVYAIAVATASVLDALSSRRPAMRMRSS